MNLYGYVCLSNLEGVDEASGAIDLATVEGTAELAKDSNIAFNLRVSDRSYHLRAHDSESAQQWVDSINAWITFRTSILEDNEA